MKQNIAWNGAHCRITVVGNKLLINSPVSLQQDQADRADDYPKRSEYHPLSALWRRQMFCIAQRINKMIAYHVCAVLCYSLLLSRFMLSLQGFQTRYCLIWEGSGGQRNKRTLPPWRPCVCLCKRRESSAYFTLHWNWEENLVGFMHAWLWTF